MVVSNYEKEYAHLKGKKLLILAASANEAELVKRARQLGVYTIVTDYYDLDTSIAKKEADEYWDISWSDIDALEKKCREAGVDGVTAGYSEFTVENLIKLCKRLDFPCYCTEEQLNITRDKILFKEECRKNNVPVIKEYKQPQDVDSFPVIVKPVDRAGSIGISIATNEEELIKAYDYAMKMSVCKKVIIEDFISDCTKFDAYYGISNGNIFLLTTDDTINAENNRFEKVIQSAWLVPSKYHKNFVEKIDVNIRNMIRGMGIKEGFIFFSGFADGKTFSFFECGFRLSGEHAYNYVKSIGYPDIQDLFIVHALTGDTSLINMNCDVGSELKGVILNFYAKKGKFSHFECVEEIKDINDCKLLLQICKKGKECTEDNAILTKLAMVHLYNKDTSKLKNSADKTYSLFKACDSEGNDMIYDRINTDVISTWWDKQ